MKENLKTPKPKNGTQGSEKGEGEGHDDSRCMATKAKINMFGKNSQETAVELN